MLPKSHKNLTELDCIDNIADLYIESVLYNTNELNEIISFNSTKGQNFQLVNGGDYLINPSFL